MEQIKKKNIWKFYLDMLVKSKLPYVRLIISLVIGFLSSQLALDVADLLTELKTQDLAGELTKSGILSLFWVSMISVALTVALYLIKLLVQAEIDKNMQGMAVDKMLRLRLKEFKKVDPREMVSRVTVDATKTSEIFITLATEEAPRIYFMVGALIKIFTKYDTTLGIAMLISIPVAVLFAAFGGKYIYRKAKDSQAKISKLTAILGEKINNVQIIKSYNNQDYEAEEGTKIIDELTKTYTKQRLAERINSAVGTMATLIPTLSIIVVGAVLLFGGSLGKAEFIGFYTLGPSFIGYVVAHYTLWISIKTAQGSTIKLAEIMELEQEEISGNQEIEDGNIKIENVSFAYDEIKVLDDVSLEIEKGKKTAFVGYSGSGKSTILNLIERFYEIEEGTITFAGVNTKEIDLHSLRSKFMYISQNAPGFSGSIRNLLTYGLYKDISDEELNEVLEKVDATKFVNKLGGLEYDVGVNATKLSGGQKQKLSVARALLSDADYMLLDEATSALDVEATEKLQKLLDEKMKGKTMVLVAHDMNTITNADKVVVFANGKVVDQGHYSELLSRCKLFKELVGTSKRGE